MLFPLSTAQGLGSRILESISDQVSRSLVCGSVRRQRPHVHDLDIVVIPKPFAWHGMIVNSLIKDLGAEIVRNGDLIKQLQIEGIPVDLIHATDLNWGIRTLRWTGSKDHNILLAKRAKRFGMKLKVSEGLITKDGKHCFSASEEDIFKALRMDFVKPEDREHGGSAYD